MKKRLLTRNLLLASAIALTGCQVDFLLGKPPADEGQAASQKDLGRLSLGIQWPNRSAYQSQVIPHRTDKLVVTLYRLDANGQPQPVLDHWDDEVAPAVFTPESEENYVSTGFLLKKQNDVHIKVEAIEIVGNGEVVIASAERIVDIIPGYTQYVTLDLVMADGLAPELDPLQLTTIKVGQPFAITGKNLGFDPRYEVKARLVAEGPAPIPGPDGWVPPSVMRPAYEWSLQPTSNTEIMVTIPKQGYFGPLTSVLSEYFQDTQNQVELYLYLIVDGVPTNRLPLPLPRTGGLEAAVTITEGSHATPSTGVWQEYALDARDKFDLSSVPGTSWSYENQIGLASAKEWKVTVFERDSKLMLEVIHRESHLSSMFTMPFDDPLRTNGRTPFAFLGIKNPGQLQRIGVERVVVPAFPEGVDAEHYYAPTAEGGKDLWFAPGIGLVKEEHRSASYWGGTVQVRTETTVLTQFSPGAQQ